MGSSSPNTPTMDESLFDLDDENDLEEEDSDNVESKQETINKTNKSTDYSISDEEKVEKDSSMSQEIPSIDKINKTPASTINDMHLDSNNKEDKIRHRNKSSDVTSESQPSSEQSIDNKNTKMSDAEVRDENKGIKSKDDSRSTNHQSLLTNDTKPLTTLKQSNKETKLDKEH